MPDAHGGFTLLELIVVIVVMGLIFGIAVPQVENLSPMYSARAAARELGSELEFVRTNSILERKTYGLHYDLDRNIYAYILPPPEDEPDLPFEEWELGLEHELPGLVQFKSIQLADGMVVDSGSVDVILDPLGAAGSHIVTFVADETYTISMKFNALIGSVDFEAGEMSFVQYR